MCDAIAIKIDDKNNCLTEEQRVRARYDYKQATKSIFLWKAHPLRTVTQEKAKKDILANLDKGSTLMIMDWAMKFQPMKFRERVESVVEAGMLPVQLREKKTIDLRWTPLYTFLTPVSKIGSVLLQLSNTPFPWSRWKIHNSPKFTYALIMLVVITTLSFSSA